MYTILNPDLDVVGILDLEGKGCKFYKDLRSTKLADDQGKIWSDTLTISVPYGYRETEYMTQGHHLLKEAGDGRFYCYRIFDWEDSAIGPVHVKTVQAINLLAWDLSHKNVPARTFSAATSRDGFDHILKQTGWEVEEDDFFGGTKTLEITAGNNGMYWADYLIQEFDIEIRAYVQLYNGKVSRKLIDLVDELGDSDGRRFEYSHGLAGVSRRGSDQEMYTKLFVYGGNNKDGIPVSISSVNNGRDYIVDDDANDLYNNGGPYLEGYIVNDQIQNPSGLLEWGKRQLDNWNHPKFTYQVDVAQLDFIPNIGDHVQVLDFSMQPEMTVSARVIQLDESEANPNDTKVILGEFVEIVTITPRDIWDLQAKASQAQQAAEASKGYRLEYFTPDGTDFADTTSTKRIVIRVYWGTLNVTEKIQPSDFSWQKIDSVGVHDTVWEEAHEGVGNIIEVGPEVVGCTIRCEVNTEDLDSAKPTLYAEETDAAYFATLQMTAPSGWTDFNKSVAQYAQVDYPRQEIYWSQKYYGDKRYAVDDAANHESYTITRTDMTGVIKDRMWCIRAGHGAQFGIEYVSGKMWIWSYYKDVAKNEWYVVRFPYTPNKVLDWGDPSIQVLVKTPVPYRTNLDNRNGYVLCAFGVADPGMHVFKKSDILKGVLNPVYAMKASDIDFFGKEQTYQSTCLDFPYIYFTSGSFTIDKDQKVLYCIDVRSKSLVYRIVYTFDKGTIQEIKDTPFHEPETISFYYDDNGKKWLIQGFAFGNEIIESSQRTNQLYRINEHKRGE
jgi:phage minor structural protein